MTDQTTTSTCTSTTTYCTDFERIAVRLDNLWSTEHFRGSWFKDLDEKVGKLNLDIAWHPQTTQSIRSYLERLADGGDFQNFRITHLRTVSGDNSKLVSRSEAKRTLEMHGSNQVRYTHVQDVQFIDRSEGFALRNAIVTIEIRIRKLWDGDLGWIAVRVDSDEPLNCASMIEAMFAIDEVLPVTVTTSVYVPDVQSTATADMHDSLYEASRGADAAARDIRVDSYTKAMEGREDVSDRSEAELIEMANEALDLDRKRPNWFQRVFGRG